MNVCVMRKGSKIIRAIKFKNLIYKNKDEKIMVCRKFPEILYYKKSSKINNNIVYKGKRYSNADYLIIDNMKAEKFAKLEKEYELMWEEKLK